MTTVEKMSIALPPEMAATVRQAVEAGEYASNSEVIREALRDWSYQRDLRQRGLDDLRAMWDETMIDTRPTSRRKRSCSDCGPSIRPLPTWPTSEAGVFGLCRS